MCPGYGGQCLGLMIEHRSSVHARHGPKVACNSGDRTFCGASKRCNSNDAISNLEIRARELHATFLRNHNTRPHKEPQAGNSLGPGGGGLGLTGGLPGSILRTFTRQVGVRAYGPAPPVVSSVWCLPCLWRRWYSGRRRPLLCEIPEWFPSNVARNSPASISNIEFRTLELQRFRAVSKNDRGKLRATFVVIQRWGELLP